MTPRDQPCRPRSRASRAAWARARRIDRARIYATRRIDEATTRIYRALREAGYLDPADTLEREMRNHQELVDKVCWLVFTRALDNVARQET